MCHRTRSLSVWGLAALVLIAAPPDPVQASARHEVALSRARVSMLEKDRIVVSFDAAGDIRGLVTVTIDRGADGALSGEWVLVSRYLRDLTAEGSPDDLAVENRAALPGEELHALHQEYIEIRERGTLRGSIAGGALAFDVDGRLNTIESLQLAIAGGSIEFEGATGAGSLTGANLRDDGGTGTLSLTPGAVSTQGVK
jgi:hypothetical protein